MSTLDEQARPNRAPYSFTMNWMFTRPGAAVRFDKGEPYCHIFPIRRGQLETFVPQARPNLPVHTAVAAPRTLRDERARGGELHRLVGRARKRLQKG